MRHMKRTLAGLAAVVPFLWGAAPLAVADTAQPAGKVLIEGTSVGAGVGVNWGDGTLTYQGRDYKFSVSGLNLVDVGISRVGAVGNVYNLEKVSDLEGTYFAGKAGFALVGGADAMVLRNTNGVVITLKGAQEGAKLALGPAGVHVSLED